jgi:hypothetical protein
MLCPYEENGDGKKKDKDNGDEPAARTKRTARAAGRRRYLIPMAAIRRPVVFSRR